jgi:hypothetical protein
MPELDLGDLAELEAAVILACNTPGTWQYESCRRYPNTKAGFRRLYRDAKAEAKEHVKTARNATERDEWRALLQWLVDNPPD